MNNLSQLFRLVLLLALTGLSTGLWAQDVRMITSPDKAAVEDHDVQVHSYHFKMEDAEPAGPVTFLGVETVKASATLAAQLGLPPGFGLVVMAVTPESGAAAVLEPHDILTRFGDQKLVSADQLGTLVRAQAAGDKVVLTLLRAGQEMTVEVELGERVAARPQVFEFRTGDVINGKISPRAAAAIDAVRQHRMTGLDFSREDVNTFLHDLRGREHDFAWVDRGEGAQAGHRIVNLNRGNVMFSDEEGVVELRSGDETTELIVKDPSGHVIFEGPVDTPEQRKALAEPIRNRLEKIDGLGNVDFEVHEDFPQPAIKMLPARPDTVRLDRLMRALPQPRPTEV